MDNEMLKIAMEQSAIENNAKAQDFLKNKNIVTDFAMNEKARAYYFAPISCNLVSYGTNIVAMAVDELQPIVEDYINRFTYYHCFETPNLHYLNERVEMLGHKVCFMAEYYLPAAHSIMPKPCKYETKILHPSDYEGLYLPEWRNALCEKRKDLDVLGVGAYDNGKLVGLAGATADCERMWQIGVDVLPEYRRKGVATAVTSLLAKEIIRQGKVPFYCSAWSNLPSVRNAIASGFVPAWVELTIKPAAIVNSINKVIM